MDYKVLITTSGLGQRLGDITKYTNKSLVRVGKKPAISHIIEAYLDNVPLVITIGHFGKHVKDFVQLVYPKRNIEFVDIDKYSGTGSSLGYSMLQAKDKLQCPFIYHACDTIVSDNIPAPEYNWVGGCAGNDTSQYASLKVLNDKIVSFACKGSEDFDYMHIGLVGVKDYEKFWFTLSDLYSQDSNNDSLNDFSALVKMLNDGAQMQFAHFPSWLDIGNMSSLKKTRGNIGGHFENLDKVDESIYMFDDFVVKFFHNKEIVKNRVARAEILKGLVPEVDGSTDNFYRYKYTAGDLYSEAVSPKDFSNFLDWAKKNVWRETQEVKDEEFKKICLSFYRDKTINRVKKFLASASIIDKEDKINGEIVPALDKIISAIDFDWLTDARQCHFHGDFILDNILKTKNGYCLLDWRQDFGGLIKAGDMYYDLAKLNHNLIVNHGIVHKNLFTVDVGPDGIKCDIMRKDNLVACQFVLFDFARKEGYDADKIKILTAIIWLNMSPLHHHPFNLFLYYFGKLNLWRAINSINLSA